MRSYFVIIAAAALAGCLGPLVDDDAADAGSETLLLPAGSEVPSLHDDPQLDAMVDEHDGVDRFVERLSGFAGGEPIHYWDFGVSPDFSAPVWVVGTPDGEGGIEKLPDHPVLFDVVPGDAGYTPIWQVFLVFVTDAYDGERITSVPALQEAQERGLVETPVPVPMYVNCPVVDPEVRLELGGGAEPLAPSECYYRGMRCYYFDVQPPVVADEALTVFPVQNAYVLRREGGEPLSEPVRNVDMTGDGDLDDTNNLFDRGAADEGFTPLVRAVSAAVPAGTGAIDTYGDEEQSDVTDATALFTGEGEAIEPIPGAVVAFEVGDEILNWPVAPEQEGGDR